MNVAGISESGETGFWGSVGVAETRSRRRGAAVMVGPRMCQRARGGVTLIEARARRGAGSAQGTVREAVGGSNSAFRLAAMAVCIEASAGPVPAR